MPQAKSSLLDELLRVSPQLDEIIGDMSSGRPSQPGFDGHADQVVALATRMIAAARGPGRPVNPPLARHGSGYVW